MKKQSILNLMMVMILSCSAFSSAAAAGVFNSNEMAQIKQGISKQNLDRLNATGGVDAANDKFFDVVTAMAKKVAKLKPNAQGFKLQAVEDKDVLIYVVNMAQYFTNEIDGGLIHFFGFAQLYRALPHDMEWAIQNSSLSYSEKQMMLEVLQSYLVEEF